MPHLFIIQQAQALLIQQLGDVVDEIELIKDEGATGNFEITFDDEVATLYLCCTLLCAPPFFCLLFAVVIVSLHSILPRPSSLSLSLAHTLSLPPCLSLQLLHSKKGGAGFPDKDAMEKIIESVKAKSA
jgi:hypothetical protein